MVFAIVVRFDIFRLVISKVREMNYDENYDPFSASTNFGQMFLRECS